MKAIAIFALICCVASCGTVSHEGNTQTSGNTGSGNSSTQVKPTNVIDGKVVKPSTKVVPRKEAGTEKRK